MFYGLTDPDSPDMEEQKFEYVILVLFEDNFRLKSILELPWTLLLKYKQWPSTMRAWNLSITRKLIDDSTQIYLG